MAFAFCFGLTLIVIAATSAAPTLKVATPPQSYSFADSSRALATPRHRSSIPSLCISHAQARHAAETPMPLLLALALLVTAPPLRNPLPSPTTRLSRVCDAGVKTEGLSRPLIQPLPYLLDW